MALITNSKALDALALLADKQEKGRSAYWRDQMSRFSVSADGAVSGETVLGSVSRKTGTLHTLAHWLLQAPFRYMGRGYGLLGECDRLGRQIARRQGRQFTHDMMRQVLSLALIRHYVDLDRSNGCNLVIGDGFGVMSSLFLLAAPHRKTIVVNLTKSLLIDTAWARKAVPDAGLALAGTAGEMAAALKDPSIRLIAVCANDAPCISEAPVSVAVNIVSMQEMDPDIVGGYFDILRRNTARETVFYCANKLNKRLGDGAVSTFMDYPWHEKDDILHDEICPWSQWIYSPRPPFWHYRHGEGRVIWHRLAKLKDHS